MGTGGETTAERWEFEPVGRKDQDILGSIDTSQEATQDLCQSNGDVENAFLTLTPRRERRVRLTVGDTFPFRDRVPCTYTYTVHIMNCVRVRVQHVWCNTNRVRVRHVWYNTNCVRVCVNVYVYVSPTVSSQSRTVSNIGVCYLS